MNTDRTAPIDGNAIVFCEGAFTNTYGKTAHGLVRRTRRYRVTATYTSEGEGVVQERIVGRYLRLKTALRRACAAAGHQF